MNWPKLSEQLAGPKAPDRCQSCGVEGCVETLAALPAGLARWIEHDHLDGPTNTVVVLCHKCANRMVEPHPRLYAPMEPNRAHPGGSLICVDCINRDGVTCTLATANGGPGIVMTHPKATTVHVLRRPRRLSGWIKIYRAPHSCSGRDVLAIAQVEESAVAGGSDAGQERGTDS